MGVTELNSSINSDDSTASQDPDLPLVERAKKELPYRTRAFETLMRKYERLLFRVCFRILGNQHDADDTCQDVMVKAFHGLSKFEGRSSFKTWLLTIAHNCCYSAIAKHKRNRDLFTFLDAAENTIEASSELSTDALDVEKLLLKLSPQDREVLTLRYMADLKLEEIAEVCGLKLSATKMRIYRATEQLQKLHEN